MNIDITGGGTGKRPNKSVSELDDEIVCLLEEIHHIADMLSSHYYSFSFSEDPEDFLAELSEIPMLIKDIKDLVRQKCDQMKILVNDIKDLGKQW